MFSRYDQLFHYKSFHCLIFYWVINSASVINLATLACTPVHISATTPSSRSAG